MLVFAAVALVLIPLHAVRKEKGRTWVAEAHASVSRVLEPLRREGLAPGARILFLADSYPKDDYLLTFIFRLRFRDNGILVDRERASDTKYDAAYRMWSENGQNWILKKSE